MESVTNKAKTSWATRYRLTRRTIIKWKKRFKGEVENKRDPNHATTVAVSKKKIGKKR